ncbi:phospho-2-dehydro-3-deoxyheptonate aldolase [Pseudomonas aeruginosa]|nr:phospho-2-dehydro-3-deoxyheptonate aldolase [Pseudomonas aeruginosa]
MDDLLQRVRRCEALQQPEWGDPSRLRDVQAYLRGSPALIRAGDILALRATLARVARGEALVVQCGDCAEDMDDHHAENVARKAAVLELLAGALRLAGRRPVIRVGRIAGQYAKPRSKPHEQVGEQTLPVYRGDMVNGREAHAEQRRADPQRILKGYAAARNIMRHLGWDAASGQEANASPVWTSHEMLLLDYELSMLREDEQRRVYLGSTHWPWIGERTRQVDGAHVALLAEVLNPVACKVGPEIGRDQLLALCERLDPRREPGRLTLIARMGAQKVGERLPPLVEAVRAAGHPVIWLSDPMHGNTIVAPCGNKTRLVRSIAEEVAAFRLAVSGSGGVAAGLHLETTPDDVTECVADSSGLHQVSRHYTSLCDPRLNPWQALSAGDGLVRRRSDPERNLPPGDRGMSGIPEITAYPLPTAQQLPANLARWSLEPRRAVLLVHDMQRYFLRPLPESLRAGLVANAARLRRWCVEQGVQIAYTAQPGSMTEEQRGLLKDFWGPGMRASPADREVVEELAPGPDDWLLTKWRYSAFFHSDLLQRMRAAGRDQLVLCGVYAHVGVLISTVDAYSNDIQPFLVADAIADFSEAHHRMALEYAASRCAMVVTTDEVLE